MAHNGLVNLGFFTAGQAGLYSLAGNRIERCRYSANLLSFQLQGQEAAQRAAPQSSQAFQEAADDAQSAVQNFSRGAQHAIDEAPSAATASTSAEGEEGKREPEFDTSNKSHWADSR